MALDKNDKKHQPILEYFQGKKALVVHPSSSIRMTIRKVLTGIGISNNDITQTDSLKEATKIVVDERPNFVFSFMNSEDESCLELSELSAKSCPNRLRGGFFLLTSENSSSISSLMYDYEIDAIITQPYTNKSLESAILNSIEPKVKPTPAFTILCNGKEQLFLNDEDKAYDIFTEATMIGKGVATAFYYLARIESLRNNADDAISFIADGLKDNPKNYYCLSFGTTLLFDQKRYVEAYDYAQKLLENYPLSPMRIPELIRLSIATQNFEDIVGFGELFKELENLGGTVKRYISAGLATCGRYLVKKDDFESASPILKEALSYSNGKVMILENIVWSYCLAGELLQGRAVYQKMCEVFKIDENRMKEYDLRMVNEFSNDITETILLGAKIIGEGVSSFSVFKLVLNSMIGLDRKEELREDIIHTAIKKFPESKDEFLKYLN
ncbi:MAG: hypothetical protein KAG61_07570 [Bacteriovoracaceae bacterium]|nr:hypothetical protein [Bacteriovoracaceae bacterium]